MTKTYLDVVSKGKGNIVITYIKILKKNMEEIQSATRKPADSESLPPYRLQLKVDQVEHWETQLDD